MSPWLTARLLVTLSYESRHIIRGTSSWKEANTAEEAEEAEQPPKATQLTINTGYQDHQIAEESNTVLTLISLLTCDCDTTSYVASVVSLPQRQDVRAPRFRGYLSGNHRHRLRN